MRELVALLCLTACGFEGSPGVQPDEGSPVDQSPGAEIPLEPVCKPGFFNICGLRAPAADLIITSSDDLDTDSDLRCRVQPQSGGPEVCMFFFRRIELQTGATLTVHGRRPFALIAKDTMIIKGIIDVSSKRARTEPGAGSQPVGCASQSNPVANTGGGGGGAGGSLATAGGNGGIGNRDGGGTPANAAGGIAGLPLAALSALRGGCNGQEGGIGSSAPGGLLGLGGGAVYLAAASMNLSGSILAGGAGGGLASTNDGGGGGGCGGMIIVEGGSLAISGTLLATGGGGGAGRGGAASTNGLGEDALTEAAAKGGRMSGGGDGGDGALLASGAKGADHNGGGGGGGGGAGYILLITGSLDSGGAKITPTPTVRPLE